MCPTDRGQSTRFCRTDRTRARSPVRFFPVAQGIVDCLAFAAGGHHAFFPQTRQHLADGGLAHVQKRFQLTHGPLARAQVAQDHKPSLMRQGLEKRSSFGRAFLHISRSFRGEGASI